MFGVYSWALEIKQGYKPFQNQWKGTQFGFLFQVSTSLPDFIKAKLNKISQSKHNACFSMISSDKVMFFAPRGSYRM